MAQLGASSSTQPPVVVDPTVASLNAHANAACEDAAFFQSGAVELAVKLLGQYLFFHDTKIAVRILETDAYPEGDEVFTKKLNKKEVDVKILSMKRGKLKGGALLAWSDPCCVVPECSENKDLFITAGSPDKGDLVVIRSCEPILGLDEIMKNRKNPTCPPKKNNLLIGPTNVSEGVGAEPFCTRTEEVQLFYGARNEGAKVKREKRVLEYTSFWGCEGKDSLFRFALATEENYKYSKKRGGLQDWNV